jgi:hypothetical protein
MLAVKLENIDPIQKIGHVLANNFMSNKRPKGLALS